MASITPKNQCPLTSLQESRNINFTNSPSVYTLIRGIKCWLGWVRLFAASEVVLHENAYLYFGGACVTRPMPRASCDMPTLALFLTVAKRSNIEVRAVR